MNQAEELAKVCRAVAERSSKVLGELAQKQAQSMSSAVRDEMGIAKAFMDLYSRMDPAAVASLSVNLWIDYAALAVAHGLQACWSMPVLNAAGELPKCPAGGTYAIGPIGEVPMCSIPGHKLPE